MTDQNLLNIDEPQENLSDLAEAGTPEEAENTANEAYRVFKTQSEFQACLDRALGKRLSKAREQEKELSHLHKYLVKFGNIRARIASRQNP